MSWKWLTPINLTYFVYFMAAIGGVILILYILKLRRRKVQVPFSPIWSRVIQDRKASSLFKALKRIISFLIQLLLVFLILFALTNPQFEGCQYYEAKERKGRNIFLIMDISASMGSIDGKQEGTRLDLAKKAALEEIDALEPEDNVMIVAMSSKVQPLTTFTNRKKVLKENIQSLTTLDTGTNFAEALRYVKNSLQQRSRGELLLITDAAYDEITELKGLDIPAKVIQIGSPGQNVGIVHLNVRPYLDDSLRYEYFIKLKNYTDKELRANLYLYAKSGEDVSPSSSTTQASIHQKSSRPQLFGTQNITDVVPIVLLPDQEITKTIKDRYFPGNLVGVKIEVEPNQGFQDAFPKDDTAYAVVPEKRSVKILLVSKDNTYLYASLFLRENVVLKHLDPDQLSGIDVSQFDLVIFDNFTPPLPPEGNFLLINPGGPNSPYATEEMILEPEVGQIDGKSRLMINAKLQDLYILRARKLRIEAADKVVMWSKGGLPLIVARKEDKRKIVAWAFDIRETMLPIKVAFPILIVDTINWFFEEESKVQPVYRTGEYWSIDVPCKCDSAKVLYPDMSETTTQLFEGRARIYGTVAGIYKIVPLAQSENSAPPEALLIAGNLADMKEALISPHAIPELKAPEVVTRSGWGFINRDFWRIFLLAALVLLVIEWMTYHRRVTV